MPPHFMRHSTLTRRLGARITWILLLFGCAAASRADVVYNFTTINDPDGVSSYGGQNAYGINNSGVISGGFSNASGPVQGYLYTPGQGFRTLAVNGVNSFLPYGINDAGTVVGQQIGQGYVQPATGPALPLAFPATFQGLPTYFPVTPFGINNDNLVVGGFVGRFSNFDTTPEHGFVYDGNTGRYTRLDVPNSAPTLDETSLVAISGISNALTLPNTYNVVGHYFDGSNGLRSFMAKLVGTATGYEFSGFTFIADPLAAFENRNLTYATGVNTKNQVVGSYQDAAGTTHGFLFDANSGTYTTIDDPAAGGMRTDIGGINDLGQIVGTYITADGRTSYGFSATPAVVPEPTSLVMTLVGVGCALGAVRRRRA